VSCLVFLAEAFGDSGKRKTTTKLSVFHSSLLEVKVKKKKQCKGEEGSRSNFEVAKERKDIQKE